MTPARSSETAPNLQRTRAAFVFAREQVAANAQPDHFSAVGAMRHWKPGGARAAADGAGSPPTDG